MGRLGNKNPAMTKYIATAATDGYYYGNSLATEQAGGYGLSLREAPGVAAAESQDGAHITFGGDAASGVISLVNSALIVSSNVTIDGGDGVTIIGGDGVTIIGGGTERVMTLSGPGHSVTLNNLTMRDGKATAGDGRALFASANSIVTMLDVDLIDNVADAQGGGILIAAGAVAPRPACGSTATKQAAPGAASMRPWAGSS
jgi:hypothetical protein